MICQRHLVLIVFQWWFWRTEPELSYILAELISKCLKESSFRDCWKIWLWNTKFSRWGTSEVCSGSPSFLIYINDLHNTIKFPQSSHFPDDMCLLNVRNTISKINRSLNKDLKELSFWLNANKIALNVAKTEVMLFKTKHTPCDTDLRLKLCRKRLYKAKYLRYLGIKMKIWTGKSTYMILPPN